MLKLHTLSFEPENDYNLICIHTTLEDYRLAYFINQALDLKLSRRDEDLDFNNNKEHFSLYEYNDPSLFLTYNLLANKYTLVEYKTSNNNALFYNTLLSETKISYLISDKKKVDFFLKITGDLSLTQINNITECINSIQQVITVYTTDPKLLKQNTHLIF
jgi:hypothetical protein